MREILLLIVIMMDLIYTVLFKLPKALYIESHYSITHCWWWLHV